MAAGSFADHIKRGIQQYSASVRTIVERLTCITNGDNRYESALALALQNLERPDFWVGAGGHLSVGKSSLFNAMASQALDPSAFGIEGDLLPESDRASTAVATRLRWGETTEAFIIRPDGSSESLSLDELRELRLLRQEETNGRFDRIRAIELRLPLELLRHGVVLVDTAGANEDPSRTDMTKRELAQCDAIIAVYRYTTGQVNSAVEEEFIGQVSQGKKLFSVVNQFHHKLIDPRFKKFLWETLVSKPGRGPAYSGQELTDGDVFLVNVRDAKEGRLRGDTGKVTQSGILELERRLADFLLSDIFAAKSAPWIESIKEIARKLRQEEKEKMLDLSTKQANKETEWDKVKKDLYALLERLGISDEELKKIRVIIGDEKN